MTNNIHNTEDCTGKGLPIETDDLPLCHFCGSVNQVNWVRMRVEGKATQYQSKCNAVCCHCRKKLMGKWKGI